MDLDVRGALVIMKFELSFRSWGPDRNFWTGTITGVDVIVPEAAITRIVEEYNNMTPNVRMQMAAAKAFRPSDSELLSCSCNIDTD